MEWAIIASDYLNGWGLAEAIRGTGWNGRIICVDRGEDPFTIMGIYQPSVEVWKVPMTDNLAEVLRARIPEQDRKVLFFTEEYSLEQVSFVAFGPWFSNSTWYPGTNCKLEPILDRLAFYEGIQNRNLGNVPRTIQESEDPIAEFGFPFFLRFRRTWVRGKRTPRIRLIKNNDNWYEFLHYIKKLGFGPDEWCYQEVLSLDPRDNVSVCGWHDSQTPRYIATHKLMQFPAAQGNGDVCEVLPLSTDLALTTKKVLDDLNFSGAFELEFIHDPLKDRYVIIELNPRFWMQHPLAGANLGQAMVRRYLGLQDLSDQKDTSPCYWINTIVALFRLIKGDIQVWQYLSNSRTIRVPPIRKALQWLPLFSVNLASRFLQKRKKNL